MSAAAAQAAVSNGDFSGGTGPSGIPNNWSGEGAVIVGQVGSQYVVRLDEADDGGVASGGLSRIFQDFDPSGATHLSFEFQFVSNNRIGKSVVPPDSFTAFLIDPSTKARLGLPLLAEPDCTAGFLYVDSDGRFTYDASFVTLIGPGGATNVGSEEPTSEGRRVR